jgi:hypothetical protein
MLPRTILFAHGIVSEPHGVINYKDWCRVYRLEIQSVMLVFSTQLCELLPL